MSEERKKKNTLFVFIFTLFVKRLRIQITTAMKQKHAIQSKRETRSGGERGRRTRITVT